MINSAPKLSLALQYYQAGQWGAAEQLYREVLADDPQNADAHHLLGLVALQSGKYQLAVEQILLATRLNSGVAAYHSNLGIAYHALKKLDDAIACFRQAIGISPNHAEAHNNLASALQEQGKVHEAIASWRRAVALKLNYVDAWSNLAVALRQVGLAEESVACRREVHRLMPDRADYCSDLGTALPDQGKLDEAITFFRRAIRLAPAFPLPHTNLGNALLELGQLDEARQSYERALELKPELAEAHVGLGTVQNEQGNSTEAIQHYLTAIRIRPNLAAAHCRLGIVLEERGDFSAAEKSFRAGIAADPRYAAAYAELANLLRAGLPAEDLSAQQQLLSDSGLPLQQRAALHFGLAQVFDARGEYAQAAEHSSMANALRVTQWQSVGQEYDPKAHSEFVNRIIAEFTPEFFARVDGFGLPTERPIFLVGLPRSGTTLIEQILAGHSQVFAAGELPLAHNAFVAEYGNMTGASHSGLDRDNIQRLASWYLDELNRRNATALRVIDKMPDNYLYLGFLAATFPRARFVHCRRDLRDVAVSCWMANLRTIRWASAPDDIAARFRDYQRIMDHWHDVLPSPILETSYEETVTNLEAVARRLVAWCGLTWESSCLEFHRGNRTVRTASAVQVRQPVYTTSVGRWRKYEQFLTPLLSAIPDGSQPITVGFSADVTDCATQEKPRLAD